MTKQPKLYGGRALANGVLMVGPNSMAVAIRREDGVIATRSQSFVPPFVWARQIPLLRGLLAMLSALLLAARSRGLQRQLGGERRRSDRVKQSLAMILPAVLASLLERALSGRRPAQRSRGKSLIGSALRSLSPMLAFRLSAALPTGSRLLRYHGAEHMAVNAVELTGRPDVEQAMLQSRIHPRCGTSLGFLTVLLTNVFARRAKRGPVRSFLGGAFILALSYEILRFGSDHRTDSRVKRIFAPLWKVQLLTTSDPSRDEVEVACAALEAVMTAAPAGPAASTEIV